MLKRHQIGNAPLWQRRLVIFVGGLAAATILMVTVLAVLLFVDWLRVRDCEDSGGRFDQEQQRCVFDLTQSRKAH